MTAGREKNDMLPTRDFKQTIIERVQRDPEFARAPLDEAATLFLNGEADAARFVLRDLVRFDVKASRDRAKHLASLRGPEA
jgi:hypothetical protein